MSLRYQINLRIFFSAIGILLLGGSITIWQARNAVNDEVASSIKLAVQLIEFSYKNNSSLNLNGGVWLTQLNSLNAIRHLNIQLKKPSGQVVSLVKHNYQEGQQELPPRWFINLVGSSYPQTEYPFVSADSTQLILTIQANPLDEIIEVWQESIVFFISLVLLTLLAFIAVNLAFNQSFKSIEQIVAGLRAIEKGNYQQKLPIFKVHEYDSIAKAINHMTHKLSDIQQENSALTKNSLAIQEQERQRLAQELHDELGQSLTAIKVMAVAARHPTSDVQQITQSIGEICDHLIEVVRSMMYQLHPLILTELGLQAAIDDMLKHWKDRNPGLSLSAKCTDEVDTLQQPVSIHLFRVIQECLTNIVRHADAQHVEINLYIKQNKVYLSVKDDGKGCDMDKIKSGFGLRGMQERIKTLEGELIVSSSLQQGMTITAIIPQ
ncbi:two-component system, NarL family, sensor histidine kinase UhpB [Bathymodiolus platifrons methanotrophic gill symbiont]|uniref:histidine kinase n=1 Tax=Bathymodiolus platifrons methanotrophic gill symbiont TaxID=113268 RepID=UPI000B41C986|nr:histidine kinase [Bathymodiolus platifrons methanotrophic gill symbiont]GAW86121.1 two-component system, NarL family, sensor histidine kinase UhpB [Bathymodiolus platifrons methanotrophic gill symbiont]GFO75534.1 two-component system, NarL family, sensor histidine kinase UhpB [Bathymodiolus platifrons methanotrophic gill symbiont]